MIRAILAFTLTVFLLLAPAMVRAVDFHVSGADEALDLNGNPNGADLVVFVSGNQWFAMPALFAAFRRTMPSVRAIYYETLPPGVLGAQLQSGVLHVDALTIAVQPDVFLGEHKRMARERAAGMVGTPLAYTKNTLAILVARGNPKHVQSLRDLARPGVRVAMPNPATEGIALQIEAAYRAAGGDALDRSIMHDKVAAGTTMLTSIHHRQTPQWLLAGKADAGPVWYSEAFYQQKIGSGLQLIAIPAAENRTGTSEAAVVTHARHRAAAIAFVNFLQSAQAQAILRSYGFSSVRTQ